MFSSTFSGGVKFADLSPEDGKKQLFLVLATFSYFPFSSLVIILTCFSFNNCTNVIISKWGSYFIIIDVCVRK
jgi:hypothetical protein